MIALPKVGNIIDEDDISLFDKSTGGAMGAERNDDPLQKALNGIKF